jgi:hypothetical protein
VRRTSTRVSQRVAGATNRPGTAFPLSAALSAEQPVAARASPRSRLTTTDAQAAALGFLTVTALGFADGGYWPSAWAWAALGFFWIAAVVLIAAPDVVVGRASTALLVAALCLVLWTGASTAWTPSVGRSVFEAERELSYLAALVAAVLVVRRSSASALFGGIWGGAAIVCAYALATRLVPDRLGVFDPIAGYRLSEPIGYWNALAAFAGIGALLAIGLVARSRTWFVAGCAGASLVVFLPTMYFTFSRGGWLAFGLGLAAAVAIDPRRLQLIAAAVAVAPAPAIALAVGFRSDALTYRTAPLDAATAEGHRLAAVVVGLAIVNAVVAVAFRAASARFRISARAQTAAAALLVLILLAAVAGGFARYGGPASLADRAYRSFTAPPLPASANLNERLFSFSGNGRADLWALGWGEARRHPLIGSGAGTYELAWLRGREATFKVRDAHNLFVERAAELGVVGVALLATVLAIPIVSAFRLRRRDLMPLAFGVQVAFVAHAAVDWDWELPAVTLAALLVGAAVTCAAGHVRAHDAPVEPRTRRAMLGAVVAAGVLVIPILAGNSALTRARTAADHGRFAESAEAANGATRWMPWSSDPWQLLGEAQLRLQRRPAARVSFRKAIAKDRDDWELWFDLALASSGAARGAAAVRALELNPRASELEGLRAELDLKP